jgi:hypothetical protein
MICRDRKFGFMGHLSRFAAVLAVFAWSLAASACPAVADADHEHVSADCDNDQGAAAHHGDLDTCCRYLSNTAAIIASPAPLPSIKAVVSIAAKPLPLVLSVVAIASPKPARASTGPPPTRSLRLTTYSPLAPPSERV